MSDTQKFIRFAEVYNDQTTYPSLAEVAIALGKSYQTVRNIACIIRGMKRAGLDAPTLIDRVGVNGDVPMSENRAKFMEHWGPEECIAELRRVAEIDETKVITRNYFRNNSEISESTWNRYFGTFEEFKRQAKIILSRQQHALERAIAKHASVDNYRKINIERRDYAALYVRENKNRFKTIVFASDLHDKEIDPFYLRVLIDTVQRVQPDVVSLVGDIFDLPEFGKYTVDPREWDASGRILFAHNEILKPLRQACPSSQIDLIEGNHEARLLRTLADATPALRAVLSDIHGMSIRELLGLDRFEVNYIAKADLAAFTKKDFDKELAKNYKVYYNTVLAHHFPYARNMGLPGVNGHHHSHVVWPEFSPHFGAYEWHQLGAGHKRSASYTEGEKWHNGFAICNIDTLSQSTAFDYVAITDFAVSGGKFYHRELSEVFAPTRAFPSTIV